MRDAPGPAASATALLLLLLVRRVRRGADVGDYLGKPIASVRLRSKAAQSPTNACCRCSRRGRATAVDA